MSTHPFQTNNFTLKQALLYLYQRQTAEETQLASTVESNSMGFNAFDAPILSSLAQQVLDGKGLTDKQVAQLSLRLPKYHGQLAGGEWEQIELPTTGSTIPARPSKPTKCIVRLDAGNGGLEVIPNIYPSKQIKNIGFSNFSNGAWHQNKPKVHQEVLSDLRDMFGELDVHPDVLSRMTPDVFTLPADILASEQLMGYQKEAIQFQLDSKRSIVALAPRLGKTVTTIFSVKAAGCKKVLVISPLSLLLDWKAKIKRWSGDDAAVLYKNQLPVPSKWTITNYDTLRIHMPTFIGEGWDCIIVDESLLVKNRKAIRTQTIKKLVEDANPKYAWLLSGAPTSKFYSDLWAQLNILAPKRFTSYWKFADRYCDVQPSEWSAYNIVGNKPDAADRIKKDLADIFFARTQEQVLDLPPWRIDNVPVAMGKSQDKMYGEMEDLFKAELEDGKHLLAPNQLTQMLRLIQIASNPVLVGGKDDSPKWVSAMELLEFETLPAIIWTAFIKTADHLTKLLEAKKYKVAMLTGQTKQADRQGIVTAFQSGNLDVIIAHPAVGKFGLDLFKAQTVMYLERTHDGDNYYQSLNRVRHVEAKTSPHIINLLSERAKTGGSTVDHVIDLVLQTKREDVIKLTTGNIKRLFQGDVNVR